MVHISEVFVHGSEFTSYGGLKENAPEAHMLAWSTVGEAAWEGLGDVTLLGGGVSLGVGFDVSKTQVIPS